MTATGTDVLGIFARVFARSTADAVADAVAEAGYATVQLNLSSIGLPTIPTDEDLAGVDLAAVAAAFARRGIGVWGVSLTFNLVHPDRQRRESELRRAERYLARIPELGARFATICTGTRDPADMWRAHPGNTEPDAWRDLRAGLDRLLAAAAPAGLRLGVEPEGGNVVRDAAAAERLLRELGADAQLVAVVLDPANLVTPATAADQQAVLRDAVARLGPHVECLHAKDVGDAAYLPAGHGLLDYELILSLRATLPRPVPVVVQDVTEDDARSVGEFLAAGLRRHPWTAG